MFFETTSKKSLSFNVFVCFLQPVQNESIESLDNSNNIEENYRKLVENNPNQPLAVKNYARFLYQVFLFVQSFTLLAF